MIRFWLSLPVVGLMSAFTLLPIWAHFMPTIEGRYFPVTSVPWRVEMLEPSKNGSVRFYQHFTKKRACEFLAVNWIHRDTRLRINVTPEDSYTVTTLAQGEATTGPWIIDDAPLSKLNAQTIHRCHPLWLTISEVYP